MRLALALLATGCRGLLGFEDPTLASDAKSNGDATDASDDSVVCTSFSAVTDTCALDPTMSLTIDSDATYDSTTHTLFVGTAPIPVDTLSVSTADGTIDLIIATTVTIGPTAELRVVGVSPVAIIANGDIVIQGSINASNGGAGARTACGLGSGGLAVDDAGGAPGGGGGALGGNGGKGGDGDANGGMSFGGLPGIAIAPMILLGGCAGGNGGNGQTANTFGARGAGGGAVYLGSATTIELTGIIEAGGGGGSGGRIVDGGGGGGGSGGMVFLEAPGVTITGVVAANGGGGGAGGADTPGGPGQAGQVSASPAMGGNATDSAATNGGAGGALASTGGQAVTGLLNGAGGGGGGGVGVIRIVSPSKTVSGMISPAPQ